MRRTLLPLALVATMLTTTALAACGGTSTSTDSTAQPAAPASTAAPATTAATGETAAPTGSDPTSSTPGADTTSAPSAEAPEALQFTAPLVGGGTIDFTQFAGRTVALWFWAPT